jgi:O-antigen/teichoic acid export membrane protein
MRVQFSPAPPIIKTPDYKKFGIFLLALPSKEHTVLFLMLPESLRRHIEHRPGLVKIIDNVGWLFFDKITRIGLGLLVGVWIARYLGPAQFGQLNFAIAFVGLFGTIAGLGLNGIVVRDIVRSPSSASNILGTAIMLQALAGLIAMMLVITSISILKPDEEFTRTTVIIIGISLFFKATDPIKYWYEARTQSRHVVWVENGVFVLMTVVRVALILSEASVMAFVWLTLIETVLISLGLIFIYTTNGRFATLLQWSLNRAKTLIQDSWPLLLSAMAVMLYTRIDMIMLEGMSNSREVGIYAAATSISEVWYFMPTIIISSLSPSIVACHADNMALYLMRLKRLYFTMFWLALGVSIPVSLLSESMVNILFGIDYLDAAPVLSVHMWASVAVFLGMASSQYLLAEQLQIISFYRTLIGLIFNVLLNIVLIPKMGAMGAAIATVISYFIPIFSLVLFKQTRAHSFHVLLSAIPPKKSLD